MLATDGSWAKHAALATLPKMPARQEDCLHVLYLLLEKLGLNPAGVRQIWALDQSLVRKEFAGQVLDAQWITGRAPSIPGLRLGQQKPGQALCFPCVCPRSCFWLNWLGRFANGREVLEVNGLWMQESFLKGIPQSLMHKASGNAFSMTAAKGSEHAERRFLCCS